MAFRKLMMLPVAALFFAGAFFGYAAELEPTEESKESQTSADAAVAETLAEGEASLGNMLGPDVQTLDALLKPMIKEMAATYKVSEEELALVAKNVMQKISEMDVNALQETMMQLAGRGELSLDNPAVLNKLVGDLAAMGQKDDI